MEEMLIHLKDGTQTTDTALAEMYGVSAKYIRLMHNNGTLEKRLADGTIGERKVPELKPGTRFGDMVVVRRVENHLGYKTYLVKDINTRKEAVVHGNALLSGLYKGAHLKRTMTFPKDSKLGKVYHTHFSGCKDFVSPEDFTEWAIANGFSERTPKPKLINKELGYTRQNVYFASVAKLYKHDGKTLSASEWADELGVSHQRISQIIRQNRLEEYIDQKKSCSSELKPGPSKGPIIKLRTAKVTELGALINEMSRNFSLSEYTRRVGVSNRKMNNLRRSTRCHDVDDALLQRLINAAGPDCTVTIAQLKEAIERDKAAYQKRTEEKPDEHTENE